MKYITVARFGSQCSPRFTSEELCLLLDASIEARRRPLEGALEHRREAREVVRGQRRWQRRQVGVGLTAHAQGEISTRRRQIPARVLLFDQPGVARRGRRGLVLVPLRRVRVPHLAEPSAALRRDPADGEEQAGPIDAELLHESERKRELRAPLVQELEKERDELERIGRSHAGTALRVASRTASCRSATVVLSFGSARTCAIPWKMAR